MNGWIRENNARVAVPCAKPSMDFGYRHIFEQAYANLQRTADRALSGAPPLLALPTASP